MVADTSDSVFDWRNSWNNNRRSNVGPEKVAQNMK